MINNAITYEQPLNELIRVCLRLEQLFQQVDHQISDGSPVGTRNMAATILNLLHLLDRPDVKAKLAKELSHQMAILSHLKSTPEIDQLKLEDLLLQLNNLSRSLIDANGKIGQNLREVELLNNLRLHLASPGGGCSFDIPLYHYWLQQPAPERIDLIKSWINEFDNIRFATQLILKLIREGEGARVQQKTADNGFFQDLLDPQSKLRLVRVFIPAGIAAYPEISIGRHFLSIRFYSPTVSERPSQLQNNINFGLSYCLS